MNLGTSSIIWKKNMNRAKAIRLIIPVVDAHQY